MKELIFKMLSIVGGMFAGSSSVHDAVLAVSDAVEKLHDLVVSVQKEIEAIKSGTPLPTAQLVEDASDLVKSVGDVANIVDPALAPVIATVEGAAAVGGDVLGEVLNTLEKLRGVVQGLQAAK